jgi:hypothetical protein
MRSKGDKPVCEVTLAPPRDGEPARLIVTDLYTGHSEGWELSPGVRLAVVDERKPDPAREFIREVAGNAIVAEDFTEGNECFNEVVSAAREVCGELGIEFMPGEGLADEESCGECGADLAERIDALRAKRDGLVDYEGERVHYETAVQYAGDAHLAGQEHPAEFCPHDH